MREAYAVRIICPGGMHAVVYIPDCPDSIYQGAHVPGASSIHDPSRARTRQQEVKSRCCGDIHTHGRHDPAFIVAKPSWYRPYADIRLVMLGGISEGAGFIEKGEHDTTPGAIPPGVA